VRAVVRGVHDEGVVRDIQIVQRLENGAHVLVVIDHGVVIRALESPGLPHALWLGVSAQVHVGEVHPDKDRLASLVLPLDEIHGPVRDVVVDRHHPLGGQRTGVLADLLADFAEPRVRGRVVLVRRLAVEHASRAVFGAKRRVLRVIRKLRLLFGVQVIQVAVKLVEPMHGRQEFVAIAQVVLAELPGRIAERLEHLGDRWVFLPQAQSGCWQSNLCHAGTEARLAGDERGAAGGAALLGVVVREHHALACEAVDVGRLVAHHTMRVRADVRLTDVVAPDDDDVWLGGLRMRETCPGNGDREHCQHQFDTTLHVRLPLRSIQG